MAGAHLAPVAARRAPARWALLVAALLVPLLPAALLRAAEPPPGRERPALAARLEDLAGGRLLAFNLHDDAGHPLDALKVISAPGGYLGVAHHVADGIFSVDVVASDNLHEWRWIATLARHASQAALAPLPDGSYLAAWESGNDAEMPSSWLTICRYPDLAHLSRGEASKCRDLARSLGAAGGHEGTPSIEAITGDAVGIGFHYLAPLGVDRQAWGWLTDDGEWRPAARPRLDERLSRLGFDGNHGQRHAFTLDGQSWALIEAQRRPGDWASWRIALVDSDGGVWPLAPRTPGGSRSIANPSVAVVPDAAGAAQIVVSFLVPREGAAQSEAGQAIAAFAAP